MAGSELMLFDSNVRSITLNVPLCNDSVLLIRKQMAELFGRGVENI